MNEIYDVNGVVVDAATGEIIESDGDPLERIIAAGLEAKQQIETWEKYQRAMKAAAGSMLPANEKRRDTISGTVKRIARNDRRAKPDELPRILADFELTRDQVARIYECAKELDPKLLDALVASGDIPGNVADLLITVKEITYVQFDPIRKQAPVAVEA